MKLRMAYVFCLVMLCLNPSDTRVLAEGSASSSQQDRSDRLDTLFGELKSLPYGENTRERAAQIESEIWLLWLDTGNAKLNSEFNDAVAEMERGRYAECEAKLTALLQRSETHAEIWNKRATLLYLIGRDEDALADIERTLTLEPRHFGALSGRGMVLQRQQKLKDALLSYREALETNPHLSGARLAIKLLEPLFPDL
jgi:tetratricopeptide (TPR) repeat protein